MFVDAIYRAETNPEYAGNPYIEALPGLPEDRDLVKALTKLPPFSPTERELDKSYRIQRLGTLRSIFIALPRVTRLARAMLRMLAEGYAPRSPYSRQDGDTIRSLYQLQQSGQFASAGDTSLAAQHSMALMGASGSGKSFSLRHITGLLPSVIYHSKHGKWQVPFLFIEMSYNGESIHTLASSIFAELDRLLPDGRLTETFMVRKGFNAEQRLAKAFAVAHELGVGQIIVDESQNQRSIGNEATTTKRTRTSASTNAAKVETPLTKLLITASNTSHIPMLFAGTLELQSVMSSRFTRARRMAGRGSAVWKPLERHPDEGAARSDFEVILMVLFRYQWIKNPIAFNTEWADIFFNYSQGVTDILVKLFEAVQEAAISSGLETITPELVERVYKTEFVMSSFGLQALRTGDQVLLDAVTDLFQADPATGHNDSQYFSGYQVPPTPVQGAKVAPLPRPRTLSTVPSPTPRPIAVEKVLGADAPSQFIPLTASDLDKGVPL